MPRHIETCYNCDAEYEIIYQSIDHTMLEEDERDIDDEDSNHEPCFCPFCGAEL